MSGERKANLEKMSECPALIIARPYICPCVHARTGQKEWYRQRRPNICPVRMGGQVRKNGVGSAGLISVLVRKRGEVRKDRVGSAGPICIVVRMRGHVHARRSQKK